MEVAVSSDVCGVFLGGDGGDILWKMRCGHDRFQSACCDLSVGRNKGRMQNGVLYCVRKKGCSFTYETEQAALSPRHFPGAAGRMITAEESKYRRWRGKYVLESLESGLGKSEKRSK